MRTVAAVTLLAVITAFWAKPGWGGPSASGTTAPPKAVSLKSASLETMMVLTDALFSL